MPISEAANDAQSDMVRTRWREPVTDHFRGVDFVRGVAQGPMPVRDARIIEAACGPAFIIEGPWADAPSTPSAPVAVPSTLTASSTSPPPVPSTSAAGDAPTVARVKPRRGAS